MSAKKVETPFTDKQKCQFINAALATDEGQKVLVAAMDKMFESGKWEIPDDCIAGIVSAKVDQLEAQVSSLTKLVADLSAEVRGEAPKSTGRVDAVAVAKTSKKK